MRAAPWPGRCPKQKLPPPRPVILLYAGRARRCSWGCGQVHEQSVFLHPAAGCEATPPSLAAVACPLLPVAVGDSRGWSFPPCPQISSCPGCTQPCSGCLQWVQVSPCLCRAGWGKPVPSSCEAGKDFFFFFFWVRFWLHSAGRGLAHIRENCLPLPLLPPHSFALPIPQLLSCSPPPFSQQMSSQQQSGVPGGAAAWGTSGLGQE